VLLSKKEETAVNFKTFVCNTRQDAGTSEFARW